MLDLGGEYANLRKVEVVFPDARGIDAYVLEVSSDARQWTRIVDRVAGARPSGGAVHLTTASCGGASRPRSSPLRDRKPR